jgi:hypothetical protein
MPFDAATWTGARISRPKLLARAARAGAGLYRRDRDLPAGLKLGAGKNLVAALTAAEEAYDAERRAMAPSYSPARHVKLLSALLAEARAESLRAV